MRTLSNPRLFVLRSFMVVLTAAFFGLWSNSPALAEDAPEQELPEAKQQLQLLDVMPDRAAASFGIRSLNLLKKNGDEFLKQVEQQPNIRISTAIQFVLGWLGLHQGVHQDAPVYITAVDMRELDDVDSISEQSIVLVVPFTDLKSIAENYPGIPVEDLKAGKVIPHPNLKTKKQIVFGKYLLANQTHLFMGENGKAVKLASETKPLRNSLTKAQTTNLEQYDLILQAGAREWGKEWERFERQVKQELEDEELNEEEQALRPLAQISLHFKTGLIAGRIDGGLQITGLLLFHDHPVVKRVMSVLRSGPSGTHLNALPVGNLLVAQAGAGSGEKTSVIATKMTEFLVREMFTNRSLFTSRQTGQLVGLFGELWQRLDGTRIGLYQNQVTSEAGAFAVLAILDPQQAGTFLTEMKDLAEFVNQAGNAAAQPDAKSVGETEIEKLIAQLSAAGFKDRQTATTKLALLGKTALPQLRTALETADPEVRARVKYLIHKIETTAAKEKQEILNENLLSDLKLKFGYLENAETRKGVTIDQLQLLMKNETEEVRKTLQGVLGPDWQHIRIARVKDNVVVMLGSRTDLFDAAITNLQKNDAGVGQAAELKLFRERAYPDRKLEVHLAMQAVGEMAKKPSATNIGETLKKRDKPYPLSSLSLGLEPTSLQVDVVLPFEELRYILKQGRLFGWF